MKKRIYLFLLIIISGCTCPDVFQKDIDQAVLLDLASENNRLNGELSLDYFNEDLSKLTYDFYLTYVTKNEAPSASGLAKFIKQADYHYFRAKEHYFVIALFYKEAKHLIVDNSNTPKLDYDEVNVKDSIPDLSKYVGEYLLNN